MMTKPFNLFSQGMLCIVMIVALPAGAADLDADAVRKLVSGTTWSAEKILESTQSASFDWKEDGTVCLRLGGTSGKCDDSGTWGPGDFAAIFDGSRNEERRGGGRVKL